MHAPGSLVTENPGLLGLVGLVENSFERPKEGPVSSRKVRHLMKKTRFTGGLEAADT